MSETALWILVLVAGAGTLLLRLSFLGLQRGEVPPLARRILRLVPAAVLAALLAPGVLPAAAPSHWSADDAGKLGAAMVAVVVARLCGNMIVTLAAGMLALWLSGQLRA